MPSSVVARGIFYRESRKDALRRFSRLLTAGAGAAAPAARFFYTGQPCQRPQV